MLLLPLLIPFHYKLTHVLMFCCYGCACFVDTCLVSRPWLATTVAWWCRFGECVNLVNDCPSVFDLDSDATTAETFCADQSEFFVRSFVGAQSGMCGYEPPMLSAQGGADTNAATETPWYAHYSFVAPMAVVGGVLIGVMAAAIVFKKVAGARTSAATPESAGGNGDAIQISPEQGSFADEASSARMSDAIQISTDTKVAFAGEAGSFVITNNPASNNPASNRKLRAQTVDREARHEAIKAHNRDNSRSMSTV